MRLNAPPPRVSGAAQRAAVRHDAQVVDVYLTNLSIYQVVVEAVEMQSGVATTVAMPLALALQAPAAFAGSVIDATTVATVAASPFPQPGKMAAETFVHV